VWWAPTLAFAAATVRVSARAGQRVADAVLAVVDEARELAGGDLGEGAGRRVTGEQGQGERAVERPDVPRELGEGQVDDPVQLVDALLGLAHEPRPQPRQLGELAAQTRPVASSASGTGAGCFSRA
jgi:hypothetical protein